jgi:hypothetical protein
MLIANNAARRDRNDPAADAEGNWKRGCNAAVALVAAGLGFCHLLLLVEKLPARTCIMMELAFVVMRGLGWR